MTKIEICCDSINSLKKSVDMGVSRIELCSELSVGGLTPSYGFIKEALKYSKDIPIRVLIRPRAGDFHYNNFDIEIMKNDIYEVKKLGVEGVVVGIVDNKGKAINKNNLSIKKNNKTEILNKLSEKIIDELMAGTVVYSSLILSFTSFELIRKKFKKMDIQNLIALPEDELTINLKYFKPKYKQVMDYILKLSQNKKIKLSDELSLSIEDQIKIKNSKMESLFLIRTKRICNGERPHNH